MWFYWLCMFNVYLFPSSRKLIDGFIKNTCDAIIFNSIYIYIHSFEQPISDILKFRLYQRIFLNVEYSYSINSNSWMAIHSNQLIRSRNLIILYCFILVNWDRKRKSFFFLIHHKLLVSQKQIFYNDNNNNRVYLSNNICNLHYNLYS